VKEILDGATDLLMREYAEMFKPTARCRPPHLNIDVFREDLFQSELIIRLGLKSIEDLTRHIKSANIKLGERSDDEWGQRLGVVNAKGVRSKTIDQAIKKARSNGFFLGLDASWMNN
jgi:hypothetical protein